MTACKKTPGCLMNDRHTGDCGTLRDLVVEGSAFVAAQTKALFPPNAIAKARAWAKAMRQRRGQ